LEFSDSVILAALVMVAKASFLWREINPSLECGVEEAFTTALQAMKVSGVPEELAKTMAETFPLRHGQWIRHPQRVIDIVKGYDVVVSETAINFRRRT